MKFGDNLQNLRKQKRMSQEQLAEKVNVSRQSISKWERGESYPTMNNIMSLCKIFHCKLNDIVHEDITDLDALDEEVIMNTVKFKKEKQQKMKGLSKAIYIIARICRILVPLAIPVVIVCMIFIPYLVNIVQLSDEKISSTDNKITIIDEEEGLRLKYKDLLIADEYNQESIAKIKEVLANNSKAEITAYLETASLTEIIFFILFCIILKHLDELFVNINNGDTPFTLENVKHIKRMAYLLIAAIILPTAGGFLFEAILNTDLDAGFDLYNIIEILFLFSMAYVFEYGYEIQLDSKGKIYGDSDEITAS